MGGKGLGHIAPRTTGKARISPGTSHRRGKQFTRRAARGGAERNSTIAPTQSYAPYLESEESNSASPAGGSCSVHRGPAKSGTNGLRSYGAFHHAAPREECLLLAHPRRSGSSSSRGQAPRPPSHAGCHRRRHPHAPRAGPRYTQDRQEAEVRHGPRSGDAEGSVMRFAPWR